MKLYEYLELMPDHGELTVFDKDYFVEAYFYGGHPSDKWGALMGDLAKQLTILRIHRTGVTVNLSEIIEKHMDKLEAMDLFTNYDIDSIMEDIESILAGNVSEDWMEQFIAALK